METVRVESLDDVLDALVADALMREVSEEVAFAAQTATRRLMGSQRGRTTPQTRRRAQAYFSAVVRRRVVRRGHSPVAAARFVVASVVEDLRKTGRSGVDIWDELERGWAQAVPGEVLEEYRLRLCG